MKSVLAKAFLALACFMGLASSAAFAKDAPIYTPLFSNTAVSGYDAVAYFTERKPVKGDSKFTFQYKGADWRFASAANRDKFVAEPERYAPQYGGYCAYAVAQGSLVSADPLQWKIVNDKLYLNYDEDAQKKWLVSIPEFIKAADKNWPSILGK